MKIQQDLLGNLGEYALQRFVYLPLSNKISQETNNSQLKSFSSHTTIPHLEACGANGRTAQVPLKQDIADFFQGSSF